MARNFVQLFIARMSVEVGEATLSPRAMSMIADSFPKDRRGKLIAVYSSAISLGMGLASLLGGGVLAWVNASGQTTLPVIGAVAPWLLAFLIVGLPGLVLSAIFLGVQEPRRIVVGSGQAHAHLGHMFPHVGRHAGTYLSFASRYCYMTIVAYSHDWLAGGAIRPGKRHHDNCPRALGSELGGLAFGPVHCSGL